MMYICHYCTTGNLYVEFNYHLIYKKSGSQLNMFFIFTKICNYFSNVSFSVFIYISYIHFTTNKLVKISYGIRYNLLNKQHLGPNHYICCSKESGSIKTYKSQVLYNWLLIPLISYKIEIHFLHDLFIKAKKKKKVEIWLN